MLGIGATADDVILRTPPLELLNLEKPKCYQESERVLAWSRQSSGSSRISGRRWPNPLAAKAALEEPGDALEPIESVHTPPRRPVAAVDKLAARSHLMGDSAPRRASRWTELPGRWGRRASVPRAREYFHSLEECKILTRIPHPTACFNFNNYWIGERRKVEEVSSERSAKGLRRGTRSAVLPVFPRPAAQRVPQTARKAVAAAASHLLQDTGAPGLR